MFLVVGTILFKYLYGAHNALDNRRRKTLIAREKKQKMHPKNRMISGVVKWTIWRTAHAPFCEKMLIVSSNNVFRHHFAPSRSENEVC